MNTNITETQKQYLEAVLRGDKKVARLIVDNGLEAGILPTHLYLDVLMKSQIDIGELWHDGKVSIPQERLATEITVSIATKIRELLKPRAKLGLRAVVTAVFGDQHSIGARAMADFLVMDGWEVDYLGVGASSDDIVTYMKARGSDLLCVSWVMADRLNEVNKLLKLCRVEKPDLKVIVGGGAISRNPELASKVSADGVATDPKQGVLLARKLCGLVSEAWELELYLVQLGKTIHEHRRMYKWSQDQLAEKAGVDRTYLSGLEQGKQNVSISTLVRLASAFKVDLGSLVPYSSLKILGHAV